MCRVVHVHACVTRALQTDKGHDQGWYVQLLRIVVDERGQILLPWMTPVQTRDGQQCIAFLQPSEVPDGETLLRDVRWVLMQAFVRRGAHHSWRFGARAGDARASRGRRHCASVHGRPKGAVQSCIDGDFCDLSPRRRFRVRN